MQQFAIPFWKKNPFYRLLAPLVAGIMLQWYTGFGITFLITGFLIIVCAYLLFSLLNLEWKFYLQWLQGLLLHAVIAFFAMVLVWTSDLKHANDWYGHHMNDSSSFLIHIQEPVMEKERSLKTTGHIVAVINRNGLVKVKGRLLLYFAKDTGHQYVQYGDRIIVSKPFQPIRNSGNPGAFNYERYAEFQHLFHQVYLNKADLRKLPGDEKNLFMSFIYNARAYIIRTLRKYIQGSRQEKGIAEALLIGYKEDLDKDLVQAYSNAGVVHIIAISGLHLGLIYVMLTWLMDKIPFIRKSKAARVCLLLACLWLFSILTGASASVLRSAVMFTCIVIGKNYFVQSTVYNSLATSAFLLLCYNPYLLWDVGFQLSYLALLGIVALQQPIYRLLYCRNKWVEKTWSLVSVTLAAQVSAFPLCLYYFHQFPNFFLLTNLLAVPLSTIILFAEIILVAISGIDVPAFFIGKITGYMIWLMNGLMTSLNRLPFAVWDNIYAGIHTTWVLYVLVFAVSSWLINKSKRAFYISAFCMFLFTSIHVFERMKIWQQAGVVVYNIPKSRAIDFIYRDTYHFVGDSMLEHEGLLKNFHLNPSRLSFHLSAKSDSLPVLYRNGNMVWFCGKKILLLDTALNVERRQEKIRLDLLVISRNATVKIKPLLETFNPALVVLDASNSLWKIAQWKRECITLALPCFSIPERGAYVLNIEK